MKIKPMSSDEIKEVLEVDDLFYFTVFIVNKINEIIAVINKEKNPIRNEDIELLRKLKKVSCN